MNGGQIMAFLALDPGTSAVFQGLVMRDYPRLPSTGQKPALYILNTDVYAGEGEHWCAAYFENNTCEFFDPFGLPPETYGLDRVLNTKAVARRYYNSVRVQQLSSDTCGPHCLFYSFHRCRGYSLAEILKLYNNGGNVVKSDEKAEQFVLNFGKSYALQ
jgi:hypothetical protein